jgi:hypothetical protein
MKNSANPGKSFLKKPGTPGKGKSGKTVFIYEKRAIFGITGGILSFLRNIKSIERSSRFYYNTNQDIV